MKKIKIISCFALIVSLCVCSCKKNNADYDSSYAVELTVIKPENIPEANHVNPLTKLARRFKAFTSSNDDPAVIRQRKIMEKYDDEKIIKLGIASSWEKNITDAEKAVMLAVKEVNEAGGAAGAQIELVKADDEASVDQGTRVAYKLAEDKEIFGVLGHAFSNVSTSASLVYNYNGMLMFSPVSSSSNLTRQKDSTIFRNIPEDSKFGKAASDFCLEKGWNNIAILYLDVPFSQNIANAFELQCGVNSLTVTTRDSFTLSQTESEYKNLFKKWKNNYKFDVIFVIGNSPQIKQIVEFIRATGIKQPLLGSDSFDDPRIEEIFGKTENGKMYAVSSFNDESENPAYLEFVEKFEQAYGYKPDQEGVQWYDAFKVLASAIDKAGEPSVNKVKTVLRNNSWNEAAGPYSFDEYGNITGKPLVIKKMTNGKFQVIK